MENWTIFWACVLLGAVSLFGVLAIVVTIGGVGDIRNMVRRLRDRDAGDDDGSD